MSHRHGPTVQPRAGKRQRPREAADAGVMHGDRVNPLAAGRFEDRMPTPRTFGRMASPPQRRPPSAPLPVPVSRRMAARALSKTRPTVKSERPVRHARFQAYLRGFRGVGYRP